MSVKADYESEIFFEGFKDKKEKRILLYGAGNFTKLLLSNARIAEYRIAGICDSNKKLIGQEIGGYVIKELKDVQKDADCIVINTGRQLWVDIYNQIKNVELDIYYRNGVNAKQCEDSQISNHLQASLEELEKLVEEYDIISFDLFDTLVLRETSAPEDVFLLEELYLKQQDILCEGFKEYRKEMGIAFPEATIYDIYNEVGQYFGWSAEVQRWAAGMELFFEKSLIKPRTEIVRFYEKISLQKEVYIVSDMYLPSADLYEILQELGIRVDKKRIMVSCEFHGSKYDGRLWKCFRDRIGDSRCLHIGDDEVADKEMSALFGIDSFIIPTADALLKNSSASFAGNHLNTTISRLAYGKIKNKLFNNPFTTNTQKVSFVSESDMGYCVLGFMMYSFTNWMIRRSREDKIDKLCFLARDGYLMKKIYDSYTHMLGGQFPESIYVETSCRIMHTVNIYTEADIYDRFCMKPTYYCSIEEYLHFRYGIKMVDTARMDAEKKCVSLSISEFKELVKPYVDQILAVCKTSRDAYQQYLKNIGVDGRIAVVDWGMHGTIQYNLNKFLKENFKGYYMYAKVDERHEFYQNDMDSFVDDKIGATILYEHGFFIESFFTSENGTVLRMDEKNQFVYGVRGDNQKQFGVRYRMVDGILQFMKDLHETVARLNISLAEDHKYGAYLLEGFLEGGFAPSRSVRDGLTVDGIGEMEMTEIDQSVMGISFKMT